MRPAAEVVDDWRDALPRAELIRLVERDRAAAVLVALERLEHAVTIERMGRDPGAEAALAIVLRRFREAYRTNPL